MITFLAQTANPQAMALRIDPAEPPDKDKRVGETS
jgi:hypothetical protein